MDTLLDARHNQIREEDEDSYEDRDQQIDSQEYFRIQQEASEYAKLI